MLINPRFFNGNALLTTDFSQIITTRQIHAFYEVGNIIGLLIFRGFLINVVVFFYRKDIMQVAKVEGQMIPLIGQ